MNNENNNVKKLVLSTLGHTWILDLDGTIVKHNGYKIDGEDTFLPGAKEFLLGLPEKDMIIFLTSRTEKFREDTESFLQKNAIRYDHIIFDAPYGERILVNDNKPGGLIVSVGISTSRDVWSGLTVVEDEKL
jgi:ribonucleotide monophosphatase NagD (HAD superfamily)